MITADFHMHTNFSFDSQSSPAEMIEGAIDKGLKTICITDHYDKDIFYGDVEGIMDITNYYETLKELQEQYRTQIDLRIGIEIGIQPHLNQHYIELSKKVPFDFIIGSKHSVEGQDIFFYNEFFEKHNNKEAYRIILEEMLLDVKETKEYDVLGHIDYMVRYGTEKTKDYSYQNFSDEIDAILRRVIEDGKGIELNMSGFKYGLGFCHPHPDIIKRYRELGGEIITIGADGHRPDHIAYDYERVKGILEACGFTYYTEFKERKPIFKSL